MSHEILISGKERIRHGFDWTVRKHPSVAAGIAGTAIMVTGAYVAVHADHGGENLAATRPPAAVGSAPAAPSRGDATKLPAPPSRSGAGADRPSAPGSSKPDFSGPASSGPRSGPGAPPGIAHPPRSHPSSPRPPAADPVPPTATPRPIWPSDIDCVLRADLLGHVVKICP